jgi:hypothetical protein
MLGYVPVPDPSRADLQHHEHVEDAERRRDHYEKIACQHGARVIPHESAPELRPRTIARRATRRHVARYRLPGLEFLRAQSCAGGAGLRFCVNGNIPRLLTYDRNSGRHSLICI